MNRLDTTFTFPLYLLSILRWRHWLRYSSCRMEKNITKCICKQAESWLTKQNLLIQWFEALDRNFCQQCRLRDTKKNEICDDMALMFLTKSILLTDWITVEKNVHILNAQVVSLWQNMYSSCCFCSFAIYSIGLAFSHTKKVFRYTLKQCENHLKKTSNWCYVMAVMFSHVIFQVLIDEFADTLCYFILLILLRIRFFSL